MNKVILMGRLTRDPEIRYSQQGDNQMAIARYTLAVDRRFNRNNDQSADFISCVAFGKTAEFIRNYVHKGTKVCLNGRIQTGSYTNKEGQKVYTTDVVVENIEFAESKNAAAQGDYTPQPQSNFNNGGNMGSDDFMSVDQSFGDDGLPFG
mgnify:CR=1 FL=1